MHQFACRLSDLKKLGAIHQVNALFTVLCLFNWNNQIV